MQINSNIYSINHNFLRVCNERKYDNISTNTKLLDHYKTSININNDPMLIEFINTISDNNLDNLHILLSGKYNLPTNITPLKIAIIYNNNQAISTIKEYINRDYLIDDDSVMLAIQTKNLSTFYSVMDLNVNINYNSTDGYPLIYSLKYSEFDIIDTLLDHLDLDLNIEYDDNLLYLALIRKLYYVINILLDRNSIVINDRIYKYLIYTPTIHFNKICGLVPILAKYSLSLFTELFITYCKMGIPYEHLSLFIPYIDITYKNIVYEYFQYLTVDEFKDVLQHNVNLVTCNSDNSNLLMHTLKYKYPYALHILEKIKSYSVDDITCIINQVNYNYETPLMLAIKNFDINNEEILDLLLSFETLDCNCQDSEGKTPLIISILDKKMHVFSKLLDSNHYIDLNKPCYKNITPFMYILDCLSKYNLNSTYYDFFDKMMAMTFDINQIDYEGRSALYRYITDYKKVDNTVCVSGYSGLTYLASNCLPECAQLSQAYKPLFSEISIHDNYSKDKILLKLLENLEIDINLIDYSGKNALMYAYDSSNMILFNHILQHKKLNINSSNFNLINCLYYILDNILTSNKSDLSIQFLKQLLANPDINLYCEDGTTPLTYIYSVNRWTNRYTVDNTIPIVNIILNKGIDVNRLDQSGFAAIHYAVKFQAWYHVDLLLQYKADIYQKTSTNETIQMLAGKNNSQHILNKILDKYKDGVTNSRWFFR